MRMYLTRSLGVLAALGLALTAAVAQGQQGQPEFQQIRLTEKHVQGFIAAQKDLSAISSKLQAAGDKPDPKLQTELENIAKKNGFKNFNEFDDVAANISMVMAGLDPQSGEYSDPIEMIKKEMEEVRADRSMQEADKKQTLSEMEDALKNTPPLQFRENVSLVKKYQKEIEKALQ
jgi:hypothetical protein